MKPLTIPEGVRFGSLAVVRRAQNGKAGDVRYSCSCDCGKEHVVSARLLRDGSSTSCGCKRYSLIAKSSRIQKTTHGRSRDRIYMVWNSMIQRCVNPRHRRYADYGGRGITVCDRWMKFENFLADMGEKPDGLTLDRIDNGRGYEPENCRWATYSQQNKNRRSWVKVG